MKKKTFRKNRLEKKNSKKHFRGKTFQKTISKKKIAIYKLFSLFLREEGLELQA